MTLLLFCEYILVFVVFMVKALSKVTSLSEMTDFSIVYDAAYVSATVATHATDMVSKLNHPVD